ncbi:dockerin type I domain-containing protein [Stieleria varia]|uniref:Serralysin n=1 Tax=Stieleria varia TaxID=2528005 RepID=A0A5C6AUD2_9BACT|nr:dockerin type I domain-containing protein [Stieleria varia]TWU02666.1 Serralysin precursor [Stieleria varia]
MRPQRSIGKSPRFRKRQFETLEQRTMLSATMPSDLEVVGETFVTGSLSVSAFLHTSEQAAEGEGVGMLMNNSPGTKFYHPTLSSADVLAGVNVAAAAYGTSNADVVAAGLAGWQAITSQLTNFGLPTERLVDGGFLYRSNSYPLSGVDILFPGTAEAVLLEQTGTGRLALGFRGTVFDGIPFSFGDPGDWGPLGQQLHYQAFSPLFDALNQLLASRSAGGTLLVAGHSLGGAMTEFFMANHPDNTVPGWRYDAVAVASPQASFASDSRVLNVGHESDAVYSIVGSYNSNAAQEVYPVFESVPILGDVPNLLKLHGAQTYRYSTEVILSSVFYDRTNRESRVLVSLTEDLNSIANAATDFFSADAPSVILGTSASMTSAYGFSVSQDDFLIGGGGDDFLQGFDGDDSLRGDDANLFGIGGNDQMHGGPGADTFLGTPGELDGDTILDLEIGDKIGVLHELVDQDDVSFSSGQVMINGDDGFFDFFGTQVTISAMVPAGAALRVLAPEEVTGRDASIIIGGGTVIEVVEGGQDLAFVIDVTGSMSDDIEAVKSQSRQILDSVFDPERGFEGSRVAVMGYDSSPTVFTEFTEQETVEERKAAATAAINQVSISGASTENVYTALRLALNGGVGQWRSEAVSRKIILFTDEDADDPSVRPEVERLAADVNVDTPLPATIAEGEGFSITMTTIMPEGESTGRAPVPVQIFTVAIGSNSNAINELEAIAAFSGGAALRASNASEVVDAILEVINQPIYSIQAVSQSVQEGDSGEVSVEFIARRDIADGAATATLSIGGTLDSSDIVSAPITVSFEDGQTSVSFSILVRGDREFEDDEILTVRYADVDQAATFAAAVAQTTIVNDDPERGPARIYLPQLIARPHVIPGDSVPTAIIFRAISDTTISVTPIGSASAIETVQIMDGDLVPAGEFSNGVVSATVTSGGLYAIIFEGHSADRMFSVHSSAGADAVGNSPSNILNPTDVNGDGNTTAMDALMVINQLQSGLAEGESAPQQVSTSFTDVNRDGRETALDALWIVNELARQRSSAATDLPSQSLASAAVGVSEIPITQGVTEDDKLDQELVPKKLVAAISEINSVAPVSAAIDSPEPDSAMVDEAINALFASVELLSA